MSMTIAKGQLEYSTVRSILIDGRGGEANALNQDDALKVVAKFLSHKPIDLDYVRFGMAATSIYNATTADMLLQILEEISTGKIVLQDNRLVSFSSMSSEDHFQWQVEESVKVKDIIHLNGRDQAGWAFLSMHGYWWTVMGGRRSNSLKTIEDQWLLTAIPREDVGTLFYCSDKFPHSEPFFKHSDQRFKIMHICPFPTPFDVKNFHEYATEQTRKRTKPR